MVVNFHLLVNRLGRQKDISSLPSLSHIVNLPFSPVMAKLTEKYVEA